MTLTETKNLWSGDPYWLSRPAPRVPAAPPPRDLRADVAVVGVGISGAVMAATLAERGYDVVLLDRRGPLAGSTTASTALLQYDIDVPLVLLSRKIGAERAVRAWRRSRLAHESLIAHIRALDIRCGLGRRDALYLQGDMLDAEGLQREAAARAAAGLYAEYLRAEDLREKYGLRDGAALLLRGDYQADPRRLVAGFLRAAQSQGARLYAPATVAEVSSSPQGRVHLRLQEGPEVQARHAVFATGYEVLKGIAPRRRKIVSTWAFATGPQRRLWRDEAHIWQASDPYLYVRTTPGGRVICGGEDEDFADAESRAAATSVKIAALRAKLARLWPHLDSRPDYAWSGCFGQTATGLPLIGPVAGWPHCHAVMAFGGNGITFSQLGAEIVAAAIAGRTDPDADLFAF